MDKVALDHESDDGVYFVLFAVHPLKGVLYGTHAVLSYRESVS